MVTPAVKREAVAHLRSAFEMSERRLAPEWRGFRYRGSHPDRKPEPGMIRRALSEFSVDVSRSFLIGDQEADIECARRGGIPGYRFPGGNLVKFVEQSARISGADTHRAEVSQWRPAEPGRSMSVR